MFSSISLTKNTQSSSNATATFEWYVRYLDAYCQSLEDCKIGCSECGWDTSPRLLSDLQVDNLNLSSLGLLGVSYSLFTESWVRVK